MKKSTFLTILSFLFAATSFAQQSKDDANRRIADSTRLGMLSTVAEQYPILRQGYVAADVMGSGDITAKLGNGDELFKAKSQITRIRSLFNVPVVEWGKNTITATFNYNHQENDLTQLTSYNPLIPEKDMHVTTTTLGFTASFTRMDSLFNHRVIYSANIAGLSDNASGIRRVNEYVSINMPLSRTATNAYTLGLLYINDPTIPIAFIPLLSYWHQFQTGGIELFVDLPSRIMLRKQLSPQSWVTFGTELGGSVSFLTLNTPLLPKNVVNSTTELKTGPAFEYRIAKKVIFGVSGGILSTISSRTFKQGDTPSDYLIKNSGNSVPYVSFSISFLPFLNAVSRR